MPNSQDSRRKYLLVARIKVFPWVTHFFADKENREIENTSKNLLQILTRVIKTSQSIPIAGSLDQVVIFFYFVFS